MMYTWDYVAMHDASITPADTTEREEEKVCQTVTVDIECGHKGR